MSPEPSIAAAVVVVVGVAVQVDRVDSALSLFFAWALPILAGLALLGWLAREAWDARRDWQVMGPPDLGPLRRGQGKGEREEAGRS